MTDRTDPPQQPAHPGPWPEVTDISRLFDHGAPWCINAAGHPPRETGYPNPEIHLPPFECRSESAYIADVRTELDGPAHGLEIYIAQPFRFGQPRTAQIAPAARLVFDFLDPADETRARFSLALADSVQAALEVLRLVTATS